VRTERGGIRAATSGITTLSDPIILTAVVANRAPVIVFSPLNLRVNASETVSYEFICFDPDGTVVRPTLTPLDGQPAEWMSIAERGNGKWALVINAPASLAGSTRQLILAARDAESAAATVTLVLKINGRPVATPPASDLLTEQKTPLNILLGAVDPDNDPLNYLIASYPANGELDLSQLPQLKYTPADGWSGVDKITFRVNDGLIDSEPVDLFVITLPNAAPSLVVPSAQVVNPGQLVRFSVAASDKATGQRLALEMLNVPGAGARFDSTTGAFEWRPTGTQTGRHQVRFRVSDNGVPVMTDEKTVEITVVNRAPVLSLPGPQTSVVGERIGFAVGASDEDEGQALTIRATNLPTGATFSNGQFDWTPGAGQTGSYQLSFLVSDNGSPVRTATAMVSLAVNAPPTPNRPPVITAPGAVTVIGGEALNFVVAASDPDSGQSLTITNSNLPVGAAFAQNTATSGQFAWTPTAGQVGVYAIAFSVTDNGSPALSETRTVTITVLQPNRSPVLTLPGTQTALVGEQLTFQVTGADPDAGQRVTITTITANLPRGATFVATAGATGSGQFKWKPTTAQIGTYYISFTATDNGVPTSSSNDIVIIKVTPAFLTTTFTTATVNSNGVVTRIPGRQAQQYEEDLGNGAKMEMVMIPGGTFMMGSPDNEAGRFTDEGPQRQVRVSEFAMGKYEVTQGQWRAVTGSNPSSFAGDSFPVERVSWNEAKEFCRLLNQKLGLNEINGYRLPSEAEWEYAARAGTTTQFAFGVTISTEITNYYGASRYGNSQFGVYRDRAIKVGILGVANGWGLFDMHGNVSEWCEDDYHNSYGRSGAPVNGTAWVDSPRAPFRIFRGGGWVDDAVFLRAADRRSYLPGYRTDGLGFRLVRTLP
ncbi:MAG: SUMF1/EgtB/PvdO family nonheme iron enzyme, partial [Acidobacteriota bacterium]